MSLKGFLECLYILRIVIPSRKIKDENLIMSHRRILSLFQTGGTEFEGFEGFV